MRRRPEETQTVYNNRTAMKIQSRFHHTRLQMACHRVLKLVLEAAWEEKSSPCAFEENPLRWAREFQDPTWWRWLRSECTRKQMQQESSQHRHSG